MKFRIGLFCVLIAGIIILALTASTPLYEEPYHTEAQLEYFKSHGNKALDPGVYFLPSLRCKGCHGFDTMGLANVDTLGNDVNLYDDWETSMMGLSSIDPFWRAKVSHEILVNPAHSNELQNTCTSCHAPMGNYTSKYQGNPHYLISDLANDSLGLSGVGCMSCHSIGTDSLGQLFSGNIPYDTSGVAYGPFIAPMIGPMQLYVGLIPMYSDHVSESRICSSCHTLITNAVDLNGVPTGGIFVEQATYHEWLNSSYPNFDMNCQSCHMPAIEDPVKIANGYTALPGRSPFNKHIFAGANSFMLNLIRNNKIALGVNAPTQHFDSTITETLKLLKEKTIVLGLSNTNISNDTANFIVSILNKAGHKFPTGYPSRRAFVQFVVTKTNGDTLFASGLFNSSGELTQLSVPYETHHNSINQPDQVQIYEMIMGDVNSNVTTVLERAANTLKDNRIPPTGFKSNHYTYDTCFIAGSALSDPDFNKNGAMEGTGKDLVHYSIPLLGYTGSINIYSSIYYQSIPPYFLNEMFSYTSADISTFQNMYNAEDNSPILIARDSLLNVNITSVQNSLSLEQIKIYPNPAQNNSTDIYFNGSNWDNLKVFSVDGKLIYQKKNLRKENIVSLELPKRKGTYYVLIETPVGRSVKKIVNL
ncbi:MAG TPA: T9SS type A sorting domain-containing protein [Bacteroidia bacterium]|nr:T9SS type A sorting domain-containing protein [Bacteroidia bacterium]